MGIYDRDYITKPERGSHSHFDNDVAIDRLAPTTLVMMGISLIIFFMWRHVAPGWMVTGRGRPMMPVGNADGIAGMFASFSASNATTFGDGHLYTLLTSAFAHPMVGVFAIGLIWMWLIVRPLEVAVLGWRNTAALAVMTAVAGSLAHVIADDIIMQPVPQMGSYAMLAGITMVAILTLRDAGVPLVVSSLTVPARWLGFMLIGVVSVMALDRTHNGVSLIAIAGSCTMGYCFWRFDLRPFRRDGTRMARPAKREARLGVPDVEERPPAAPPTRVDGETRDRMEQLLDKISAGGMESLTAEEREYMAQASEKFRK
ncbi:MAG: hypothetical protein AB7K09_24070 [Planctomycetota bacterium]